MTIYNTETSFLSENLLKIIEEIHMDMIRIQPNLQLDFVQETNTSTGSYFN